MFLSSVARTIHADALTIMPSADTTLFQTFPDNNLGATPTLVAGTTFGGLSNRALIKFDVAGKLPPTAFLESVSLRLTVTRTADPQSREFHLHRLNVGWGEGTGVEGNIGRLAQDGEADWFVRYAPNVRWSKPDSEATNDYVSVPSAAQVIGGEGNYEFSSPELLNDIELWLTNGTANFGWILICADETMVPSSRRFGSREDEMNTPQLTITYALPERSTLVLLPVADTALFEHFPDNNLGAADLASGTIAMNLDRTRSLLRFDLSSLPVDAVLFGARLNLTVTRSGGGITGNFELHRLFKSWGEGNGPPLVGHPAAPGDATWRMRFHPNVSWESPGGTPGDDFRSEPSAVQSIDGVGRLQFTNVLDDALFWRTNSGTNFGWILISNTEDQPRSARRFASRESETNWPSLAIEYVHQLHIDHLALADGKISFSFDTLAFNRYVVECRDTLNAGLWQVCTNLAPSPYSGPVTVSFPSSGFSSFYRVDLVP